MKNRITKLVVILLSLITMIISLFLVYLSYKYSPNGIDVDITVNTSVLFDDSVNVSAKAVNLADEEIHNVELMIIAPDGFNSDKVSTHIDKLEPSGKLEIRSILDEGKSLDNKRVISKAKILYRTSLVSFIVFVLALVLCISYKFLKSGKKCVKPKKLAIISLSAGFVVLFVLCYMLNYLSHGHEIVGSKVIEERVIVNGKEETFKVVVTYTNKNVGDFIDYNNNNFPDCIEFGDRLKDTDEDGISDFDELCYIGSSTFYKDSFETGLGDANSDRDEDGLSNYTELQLGLNPLMADSDCDGLDDIDEVDLGTNGRNEDTDQDGATDGWEVEHGYDPLIKNESFENTVECFSKGMNTKNNLTAKTRVKASGDVIESLSIKEVHHKLFTSEMPGYIGNAFEFSIDGDFDEFNLGYTQDEFEPCIYYFNEDTQLLEELECEIEGTCVSAKVEHFSIYVLANKIDVDTIWNVDIYTGYIREKEIKGLDVALVCDISPSMLEKDVENYRYHYAKEFIKKLGNSDNMSFIVFDKEVQEVVKFTNDKEVLLKGVDKAAAIDKDTSSSNIYKALEVAVQIFDDMEKLQDRYIILLSDGDNNVALSQKKVDGVKLSNCVKQ